MNVKRRELTVFMEIVQCTSNGSQRVVLGEPERLVEISLPAGGNIIIVILPCRCQQWALDSDGSLDLSLNLSLTVPTKC